jgi:hypothetical protein
MTVMEHIFTKNHAFSDTFVRNSYKESVAYLGFLKAGAINNNGAPERNYESHILC